MNLLYISSALLSSDHANAVHIMKMCQAFTAHGHDVHLIADNRNTAQAAFDKYGISQLFNVHDTRRSSMRVLWNVRYIKELLKHYQDLPCPDVIYGRYIYGLTALALRDPKTPIYFEAHCLPSNIAQYSCERFIFSRPNFKGLIVISQALKDDYLKRYSKQLTADQIHVAHDGADIVSVQNAASINQYTHKNDTVNIGYSGKLTTGKGLDIIMGLANICPEYRFHIAGGSAKDIQHWSHKNTAYNVTFHGYIDHAKMPDFYNEMDILLAPLQANNTIHRGYDIGRWTSPLKIFEYMAAKKPMIASDLPVLREVLAHQSNAYLCSPSDVTSWRYAIETLLNHSRLSQHIADNAYRDLNEIYNWDKRAEGVLAKICNDISCRK